MSGIVEPEGDAEQPATPGSYGRPPRGSRLPNGTSVGAVRLQVADLDRSVRFYQEVLGLRVAAQAMGMAALAVSGDDEVLIHLVEHRGVQPVGRRARLGLFHFAILLPDRAALARLVRHLSQTGARLGAGDHLVSEAFYLSDPDGLGIEVYADRPREAWRRVGRELKMATDPVDVPGLLAAADEVPWTGMPAGTVMGHVHLHVGDLERAAAFYADGLGFDTTTWSYPGALFFGAGGYHHHVGVNTWAGAAAPSAGADDAQLLEWTLTVPDAEAVAAVFAGLEAAGHPAEQRPSDAIAARDPWGTAVRIATRVR
jgi:catechol 2,3-dioxygenase